MAKEREEMSEWTTDTTDVINTKKNLDGVITLEDNIDKPILEPPEENETTIIPNMTAEAENNAKEAENSLKEANMLNHGAPSNNAEIPEEGDVQGSPRLPRKGVTSPPKVSPKSSPKACT